MVPILTKEQRQESLAKGLEIRSRRKAYRAALRDESMTVAHIIELANGGDKAASNMRVAMLISALPGYGEKRTWNLMQRLRIAPNRKVNGLGSRQREALLDALRKE
jgi:hypothetical protein